MKKQSNRPDPVVSERSIQRALAREQNYLHTVLSEKRHEMLFSTYGITFPIYRTIIYLLIRYPEASAPSKIADELCILRQSMTNIVDYLEEHELVERTADPNDRRRIKVQLLPAGIALGKTLIAIEEDYAKRVVEQVGKERFDTYHQLEKSVFEAKERVLDQIVVERAPKE